MLPLPHPGRYLRHLTGFMHEFTRHLLRRPIVGICAVARAADGRILLVRRGDTGEWALPGGTLEWGELLSDALPRELAEETGATVVRVGRLTGVYSRPNRDWRFHSVTVVVEAEIAEPIRGPKNALEIREARLFAPAELPAPLSMGHDDLLADALSGALPRLE
jgi:8-oxo-dGTP diphosphatase